jgi:L-threonylcarbamoyladenylate synthase
MLIAKSKAEHAIEIFKRALSESEPVIFSTDTIYGIGAPISDLVANEKIFDIKGRDKTKPFPILAASVEQIEQFAILDNDQKDILNKTHPEPVTFILRAKEDLNSLYSMNGTVAVRIPNVDWLKELISHTGAISATSANPAGVDYVNDEKHIVNIFSDKAKYYILNNNLEDTSSSIIDISTDTPKILRSGKIKDFTDIISS